MTKERHQRCSASSSTASTRPNTRTRSGALGRDRRIQAVGGAHEALQESRLGADQGRAGRNYAKLIALMDAGVPADSAEAMGAGRGEAAADLEVVLRLPDRVLRQHGLDLGQRPQVHEEHRQAEAGPGSYSYAAVLALAKAQGDPDSARAAIAGAGVLCSDSPRRAGPMGRLFCGTAPGPRSTLAASGIEMVVKPMFDVRAIAEWFVLRLATPA